MNKNRSGFERIKNVFLGFADENLRKIEANLRKARRGELEEETAGPQWAGVRSPFMDSVANDLTPSTLAMYLREADEGRPQNLLQLAHEIEERDPHYQSVLNTRKAAVRGLTFTVEPSDKKLKSRKLAEDMQTLIDAPAFKRALPSLLDAIGKGFSVTEVIWDTSKTPWKPVRYVAQPQWNFAFDHRIAREIVLPTESNLLGEELAEAKFIIHQSMPTAGPLHRCGRCRTAAFFYLGKSYGLRGWLNFNELYGIPLKIGRHSPNASDEDRQKLLNALSAVGNGGVMAIPTSMQLEIQAGVAGSHGPETFGGLLDWIDSQISKLILGQTMTTDNGASLSQAKVHEVVRQDILWEDANALADTINEQLIAPYVRMNHGEDVDLPILKITQDEREDLQVLAQSLAPFIDRGLQVSAAEIAKKFGLTVPQDVVDALGSSQLVTALPRDVALNARREKDDIEAIAENAAGFWEPVMSPVIEPIMEAAGESTSYDEFKSRLKRVLSHSDTEALRASVAYNTWIQRAIGDDEVKNGK